MSYTVDELKEDIKSLSERDFYLKYIVRSENWYFENVLGYPKDKLTTISDDFRMTISEELGISFNSIMIVGSSKIGYSLSPQKLFKPFSVDDETGKASDIDVAIISSEIFEKFWKMFRENYSSKYSAAYHGTKSRSGIYCEVYRGYINEKSINNVDECRKVWNNLCGDSKKKLRDKLFIKNEVTYRIYRSWEDFEEYNLKNIAKIKAEI
jgi:hypothetical protein